MCKTRWIQRHNVLAIFVHLFSNIVCLLEDITSHPLDWNQPSVSDARSLPASMMAFESIAALHITQGILSYIEPISVSLQRNNQDVIKAMSEVREIIRALQEQRDNIDTFHERRYSLMVSTAESVNVESGAPRIVATQRHGANAPASTPVEYYKVSVPIPILDEILTATNDRFGPEQRTYIDALHMMPGVINNYNRQNCERAILAFVALHRTDLPSPDNINAEMHTWVNRWSGSNNQNAPKTAACALKELGFSPIIILMELLCTVGVTSCECGHRYLMGD